MLTQTTTTKNSGVNVSTIDILRVIDRAGRINLTDIVKAVNPDFDFDNCPKNHYRYKLDQLVKAGHIGFTKNKRGRNLYFLKSGGYVEKSKRVIFARFLKDMKAALYYSINSAE